MKAVKVRSERERLHDKLAKANAKVQAVQAELRALERMCPHDGKRRTSHMGESCTHCYDCGACDVW